MTDNLEKFHELVELQAGALFDFSNAAVASDIDKAETSVGVAREVEKELNLVVSMIVNAKVQELRAKRSAKVEIVVGMSVSVRRECSYRAGNTGIVTEVLAVSPLYDVRVKFIDNRQSWFRKRELEIV